jgi:hypothetical protein
MAEHRRRAAGGVRGGSGHGDVQTETHFGKMNLKQLGILLVLVAVLGSAGLVVYRNQTASWKSGNADIGKKLLGSFPVNDVAHISIQQDTHQLDLIRREDSWRVVQRHEYPANFSMIRDFLLKIQEMKIVQSEIVNRAQMAALRLAPPGQGTNSALVVDFKDSHDKSVGTLLLGKPHLKKSGRASPLGEEDMGWPDGRYVTTAGSETVAIISDSLDNIEPKPETWLSKDFIRIEKPETIEVDFPDATNSWRLVRETESGEWRLVDARPDEQLDSTKAAGLSYPLTSPSFLDVLPGGTPEATGTNRPTVVKIGTFDHFSYTLCAGVKTNENVLVTVAVAAEIAKERMPGKDEKPTDKAKLDKEFADAVQKLEEKVKQEQGCEKWTYLVSNWTLEPLLKERSRLLVEKKEEPKKEETEESREQPAAAGPEGMETNGAPIEPPR